MRRRDRLCVVRRLCAGAETFKEGMQIGCEVFHNLKKVIKRDFGGDATLIGDEGGFAPPCDAASGMAMIAEAVGIAGYTDKVRSHCDPRRLMSLLPVGQRRCALGCSVVVLTGMRPGGEPHAAAGLLRVG